MAEPKVERSQYLKRWGALKTERATWMAHWKEISDFMLPRSGRYFLQDRNKGQRRHNNIYDSTGTRSLRVLAAGMMSGLTSPARPWFRLTTHDPELAKYPAVKVWLADVTQLMLTVFQRSNFYRALHSMYEELGAFGTASAIVAPDFDNVIHLHPLTIGEYCIATDWRGTVTTLYREFQRPVSEVVREFGTDNVSQATRNLYERGSLDQWVQIIHAIEPRSDRDPSKLNARNMPWASVYFELGAEEGKFLRESGFRRFPGLCPRWATAGGDIWGNGPGMEALGDVKQLQQQQLRKAQAIDYKTMPPLQVPSGMKNRDVDRLPGGVSYVDMAGPGNAIQTLFDVNLDLSHLTQDMVDVRQRIQGAFFADLFLMLANQTDARMTATEVAERHEEKLLMLGPVLERLQNELLEPAIDITFDRIMETGIAPPPPPELHGQEIVIELVSMLAQAQRAIGTNSIDRFVGNLGAVAQFKPEVLDKFDADAWADIYSDSLGLDPRIIVPEDQVQAMRAQRAKQQQATQQAELANQHADTAQKVAQAAQAQPDVMSAFSGYSSGA